MNPVLEKDFAIIRRASNGELSKVDESASIPRYVCGAITTRFYLLFVPGST
jgi:hypothetical protein